MQLTRFENNPVITPTNNWWETVATFNGGVALFENKITLLYRAVGGDGLSRFGLAVSDDGYNFQRFENPSFEADINNPYERLGVEDPRVTLIDGTYYVCYTATSVYPYQDYPAKVFAPPIQRPAPWRIRPSLITTVDFKTYQRHGVLLDIDTKDAALFPEKINSRYLLFHRPYPNLCITASTDLKNWENQKILISPRKGLWDSERVGIGGAPLKTEKGWLIFYHGADNSHRYCIGVLLLDTADPTKILYRSQEPILTPEKDYERTGLTPNVVFTCGAVEKDGQYLVYYGAADKVIGLAHVGKEDLLNSLSI